MRNVLIPVLLLLAACGGVAAPAPGNAPEPSVPPFVARDAGDTILVDAGAFEADADTILPDSGPIDAGREPMDSGPADAGQPDSGPDAGGFASWCMNVPGEINGGTFWLASGSLCGQQVPVACVSIPANNQCGESLRQVPCAADGTPSTPAEIGYCVVGLRVGPFGCAPCE